MLQNLIIFVLAAIWLVCSVGAVFVLYHLAKQYIQEHTSSEILSHTGKLTTFGILLPISIPAYLLVGFSPVIAIYMIFTLNIIGLLSVILASGVCYLTLCGIEKLTGFDFENMKFGRK